MKPSEWSGSDVDALDFEKGGGLLTAVVQDSATRQVLMVAHMDRAAVEETLAGGFAVFFSRSRGGRWLKGETSGARQRVVDLAADCDGDALLVEVEPLGPACHTGQVSCFSASRAPGVGRLALLEQTVARRAEADPAESWTARLLAEGPRRCAQKVGEEGVETALAGAAGDREALAQEAADLLFHLLVLLKACDTPLQAVMDVLARRAGDAP